MNYSARLALRELGRNKLKFIIAIFIALIMFLSAFLLINLANALPENFYGFYKENYAENMTVNISNADIDLVNNADKYFDNIDVNYYGMNKKFHIINGGRTFSYLYASQDGDIDLMHSYKADYCTLGVIPDKISALVSKGFLKSGQLWGSDEAGTINLDSVWLSDKVADSIGGVTVGSNVTLKLELDDREPNFISMVLNVVGIYDYALASEKDSAFPVFYVRDDYMQIVYLSSYTTYSISGQVRDINKFYSVYNELSKSYDLSENIVIDMIITVKNSEIICYVIGGTMLFGGMIILFNFIAMLISTNRKNIGVMIALGAKSRHITTGYGYIYAGLIAIVTIISLCLLPTMNAFITLYCSTIGYAFAISTNWILLLGLYLLCNIGMILIMWIDKIIIDKSSPTEILSEED